MEEVQATVTLLVLVVLLLMLLEALAAMVVIMVLSEAGIPIPGVPMAAMAAMVVPMVAVVLADLEGVVVQAAPVELDSQLLQPYSQVVLEPSAFQVLQALQAPQVPVQPVDRVACSILNTRLHRVLENMGTLQGEGLMV
jgi:hypothetical protein